jgi:RNA polymerase sigma-70 factor, ECF subfamily
MLVTAGWQHVPVPTRPPPPTSAPSRAPLGEDVLTDRARDGDARAFEELVRRHQQAMYAVALRILADPDDAEDATQNALIAAWRQLPAFRAQARFSTWMYRIVTNHALNQLRRRAARSETSLDAVELEPGQQPVAWSDDPYRHSETSALMADLRAALAALPEPQRVCWLLREVDNCTYREVATITATSLDTVRGRIYRARQQLAEAMASWR